MVIRKVNEQEIRKRGLIATAGLVRADREEALTIEQALKELREMFPNKGREWQFISIRRQEFIDTYSAVVNRRVEIHIGNGQSPPSCEAETLAEAMAQIRKWKESRA